MVDSSVNPFWHYSVALYYNPVVSKECLRFQDNHGGNVNLLLFCCWLDCQHIIINDKNFKEINELIVFWDQRFICSLRELRKQAKIQYSDQLYQQLKDVELLAEKVLQDALYQWYLQQQFLPLLKPVIKSNVENYVSAFGASPSDFSKLLGSAKCY